jgi:hypothetical protein
MDIKPQWNPLIMRLQSMARKYDGLVIMNVIITVTGDGVPIYWIPRAVPLEPRIDANVDTMKEHLSEEQMQTLLKMIMYSLSP